VELLCLPEPIVGTVVERVNRFVALVEVGGAIERAYVNNTGRLADHLARGRRCYCLRREGGTTSLRLFAVEDLGGGALIDTQLQMRAFERALAAGLLPWAPCSIRARSPRLGASTLDYLLDCGGTSVYVELKSAVLRLGTYAAYPDCPTLRGRRHIAELARYASSGGRALIVFVAALPRVEGFVPYAEGDPEVPRLLREAVSRGVEVRAVAMHYDVGASAVVLDSADLPVYL